MNVNKPNTSMQLSKRRVSEWVNDIYSPFIVLSTDSGLSVFRVALGLNQFFTEGMLKLKQSVTFLFNAGFDHKKLNCVH